MVVKPSAEGNSLQLTCRMVKYRWRDRCVDHFRIPAASAFDGAAGDQVMDQPSQADSRNGLNQIETEWSVVFDPVRFVERYAFAIHSYLLALLKNADEAEEVA